MKAMLKIGSLAKDAPHDLRGGGWGGGGWSGAHRHHTPTQRQQRMEIASPSASAQQLFTEDTPSDEHSETSVNQQASSALQTPVAEDPAFSELHRRQ